MDKNLDAYIKVYDAIPKDLCDETVKLLSSNEVDWQQHSFIDGKGINVGAMSGNKELDMTCHNIATQEQIMKIIWDGLLRYITELDFSWYSNWNGYSSLKFNKYVEGRVMANHCDHIHAMFDGERKGVPVLSIIGALNDDYEGGEFVMFEDTMIELPKGSLLIFPANFLYPHRVDEVTRGVRHTFVSWAW
jgi:predicted 2-oxoglutarate/Fe(II)-dependent dioxygenase YbiX